MADGELILVTGASGYIAKHVIKQALAKGYRVRGTLRRPWSRTKFAMRSAKAGRSPDIRDGRSPLRRRMGGGRQGLPICPPRRLGFSADFAQGSECAASSGARRNASGSEGGRRGRRRTDRADVILCLDLGGTQGRDMTGSLPRRTGQTSTRPAFDAYPSPRRLPKRRPGICRSEGGGMPLVAVNPSFVLGPALDRDMEASGEFILLYLRGKYPMVTDWGIEIVDARDVAARHIAAWSGASAAGRRFIASGGPMFLKEIGDLIGREFPVSAGGCPRQYFRIFMARLSPFRSAPPPRSWTILARSNGPRTFRRTASPWGRLPAAAGSCRRRRREASSTSRWCDCSAFCRRRACEKAAPMPHLL